MDFDKLPKEAENYLRCLVDVEESGGEDAVADLIEEHHGDYFTGTGDARAGESHNRSIRHLAEIGMIDCQIEPGCCAYGGLTARGAQLLRRQSRGREVLEIGAPPRLQGRCVRCSNWRHPRPLRRRFQLADHRMGHGHTALMAQPRTRPMM